MGELKEASPLRIMAGENGKSKTDMLGVIIYRKRLPEEASLKEVRRDLLIKIEEVVKCSPYSYWVSPKARSIMSG